MGCSPSEPQLKQKESDSCHNNACEIPGISYTVLLRQESNKQCCVMHFQSFPGLQCMGTAFYGRT